MSSSSPPSRLTTDPEYADPIRKNRMVMFDILLSNGKREKIPTNRPDIVRDSIDRLGMFGDGVTVVTMEPEKSTKPTG